MKRAQNLIANYIGTAVCLLMPLILLPTYLGYLGASKWGLFGFASTIIAIISVIEVGIGQILSRELVFLLEKEEMRVLPIMRGLAKIYAAFSIALAAFFILISNQIVTRWLNAPPNLSFDAHAVVYFGAVYGVIQIMGSLYRSLLIARESHASLNYIIVSFTVSRHLGGAIVCWSTQSLPLFLLWYSFNGFAEVLVRRHVSTLSLHNGFDISIVDLRGALTLCRKGLVLSGAVILSVLTTQIDKIVLSGTSSLSQFGYYVVASNLAGAVLQITHPFAITYIPFLVKATHDRFYFNSLCKRALMLALVVTLLIAAGYMFLGKHLLAMWIGETSNEIKEILDVLIIGSLLNIVYQVGYQRWIALGKTRNIATVNCISLICAVLALPYLISLYGVRGAAIAWILINGLGAICSTVGILCADSPRKKLI